MDRKFEDFLWLRIAHYLGGGLIKPPFKDGAVVSRTGFVVIKTNAYGMVEVHDNGGEVNIMAERPHFTEAQKAALSQLEDAGLRANRFIVRHPDAPSVPYTSFKFRLTNVALAYRIRCFLRQEPCDWDWNEPDPEKIYPFRSDPVTIWPGCAKCGAIGVTLHYNDHPRGFCDNCYVMGSDEDHDALERAYLGRG